MKSSIPSILFLVLVTFASVDGVWTGGKGGKGSKGGSGKSGKGSKGSIGGKGGGDDYYYKSSS